MKIVLYILTLPLLFAFISAARGETIMLQAEEGILDGNCYVATTISGYSGSGYVAGLEENNGSITCLFNVVNAGTYRLAVRHASPYGHKEQYIEVNGLRLGLFCFPQTNTFSTVEIGNVFLDSGTNSLALVAHWGYSYIDQFMLTRNPPHVYNVTNSLRNAAATPRTLDLYRYLQQNFGRKILSGQDNSHLYVDGSSEEDMLETLLDLTMRTPLVLSMDLQNYSPRNPWNNWSPFDDGTIDAVIDWFIQSQSNGIVTIQWHWFSPMGGSLNTSTFYASETDFDIAQAVIPGTDEYNATIRDIDAIAVQLNRLDAAGIPILWRPLHEAGHGGFWWGASTPADVHALFDILYERLTHHHGLNNLIWVWSTPESEWYPGNDKVDVFGYDSYPGAFDYRSRKEVFDQMWGISDGQRLLAMTENGPIPDIDRLFLEDAVWSYFCTWNAWLLTQNSEQYVSDVYAHPQVVTLAVPGVTVTTHGAVPYHWLKAQNTLWTNNYELAAATDHDNDGFTTAEEYWSGTNPQDINSYLKIDSLAFDGQTATISWQSHHVDNALPPINIDSSTNLLLGWTTISHLELQNGTNIWQEEEVMVPAGFYRLSATNMAHRTY